MNYLSDRFEIESDSALQLADILYCESHGNAVRWQPGERFEHLFEARVDAFAAAGDTAHLAVDSAEGQLSFAELDRRANQLARYLAGRGIEAGQRVALLFDKSILSYVATLAVLKLNAAYVPLDGSFPTDRIGFIAEDARVTAILSITRYADQLATLAVPVLLLDAAEEAIGAEAGHRLGAGEKGAPVEELAYIIYTSGSTGRPKGVPIEHAQIVNFMRVAAEVYGLRPDDRMYQGLTIAFDFAVEEIWVPLIVGATLVPGPADARLLGSDLGDFLAAQRITALCCVPTLLATLEAELPELRYIMVSGEACPQDLVARWQKPGRIFLNAYGPTETTVTATLTALEAGKPVTIGGPLPTYTIVILDPDAPRALKRGETGEIGIAGIGVATGYLNREDLTQKVFIDDFLGLPNNASGRIYRSGDLGRINAAGQVEYMGRIDTQVKIRGYRIELTEIESVLMQHADIAQAVVNKYEAEPGAVELAAYFTLKPGVDELELDALVELLKERVPSYMVPAWFEQLETMPLLPSHKADRKKLPPPSGPRYASRRGSFVAPDGAVEEAIAAALAGVLKVATVSAEDHFFDDLGANSLLMAQFCTKLRERLPGADVSMRDTYMHPSVRTLAHHLGATAPATAPVEESPAPHHASTFAYVATGAAQAAVWVGYLTFTAFAMVASIGFIVEADGLLDVYLRSMAAASGFTALMVAVPIALKWLLVGRWRAERFPVWGMKYFRFWLVKQLIRMNPMMLFAGTPLYSIYLRLLGARIGRNVLVLTRSLPVATDLIAIGDDTVVSKDSFLSGYRVRSGWVETGPVTIGARAYVGEATLFSIDTAMGDDSQLGNSSSLQAGQSIPDGERWHGSPAQPTATNYLRVAPLPPSPWRRIGYSALQLFGMFGALAPLPFVILAALFPQGFEFADAHLAGADVIAVDPLQLAGLVAAASVALTVLGLALGLGAIFAVPRLANRFIEPGKVYPLYGLHYYLLRVVTGASNSKALNALFGDSSYITWFLQFVGWDLGKVQQMGSNFGSMQKHDVPFLSRIGTGTMVSDGLSMINAEISSTSFKVAETRIGEHNFLGNMVFYPAGGRTGDNVLLATKVLIPLDGPVRENVGLLGSPSFEIPRTVKRDNQFDHLRSGPEFERRLRAKNRSNLATMGLFLFTRWLYGLVALGLFAAAVVLQPQLGALAFALAAVASTIIGVLYFALLERLTLGFRKLEARYVSIYDPYYWHHERHWKLSDNAALMAMFNGTPFKGLIWRMVGVTVGRKLFDDGCGMTERSLVELGDHVTLGETSTLQSHTMEDATFKSGLIRIGDDVTIGANAYINYEVVMRAGSRLEPDSFLMKGEEAPAGSVWGGNPARQLAGAAAVATTALAAVPLEAKLRLAA